MPKLEYELRVYCKCWRPFFVTLISLQRLTLLVAILCTTVNELKHIIIFLAGTGCYNKQQAKFFTLAQT